MSSKVTKLLLPLFAIFAFTACGGGGGRQLGGGGNQCLKDHNPIPLEVKDKGLRDFGDDDGHEDLPPGKYKLHRADFKYQNLKTNTIIHVQQVRNDKYELVDSNYCVRNITSGEAINTKSMSGVTSVEITPSGGILFEMKTFAFSFDGTMIHRDFYKDDALNKQYKSPTEALKSESNDFVVFQENDSTYETRSQGKDGQEIYQLRIQYRYEKFTDEELTKIKR